MLFRITVLSILILSADRMFGQDSALVNLHKVQSKYVSIVSDKVSSIKNKLERETEKSLAQLQKQEAKMKQKLSSIDSLAANSIFGKANEQYKQLKEKLKTPGKLTQYIPHLDSVATS